ncbi:MAG: TIGR03619 family F420-dependent LLM class oxidoreductase [Dehalococcoidia bacterium]|nr:TIGR03619 family F420-dependent LLM class oxidoreductase [Dehalococcoidia bacterium]
MTTAAARPLTFGILPGGASAQEFFAAAQAAEALDYDSVWMGDHVLWPSFWPEPIPLLAGAGAVTSRIAVGTGILLAALRRPAALAKQTATLQWMTDGRFRLGVGAGGEYPLEFEASGVPLAERGAYLDDTLEALRALWSGDEVTIRNRQIEVEGARLDLPPDPPIPVWVGGRSRAGQRRAAQYGDAWMPFVLAPERFAEGWANVRRRAEGFDRDPDAIVPAVQMWGQFDDDISVALPVIAERIEATYRVEFQRFERYTVYGDADMWVARLQEFIDAGVRHFNFVVAGGDRLEQVTRIATDVIPRLTESQAE